MALLFPLILLAAFFLLRASPQRKRAQAQQALVQSLQPGVRVATAAGMIGTLVGTEGDRAAIEVAPGVIVEFLLAAITRTIDDPEPIPDPAPAHVDETHDDGYGHEGDASAPPHEES